MQALKTAGLGAVTPLEPEVKVASQSAFYALHTRDGTCASGCGVSQTGVAEIVFGVEIVEWDLCSAVFLGLVSSKTSTPCLRRPREKRRKSKYSWESRMRRLKGRTELPRP